MDRCGMFNGFTKRHISEIMEYALSYSWCVGFSPKRFFARSYQYFAGKSKDIPENYMAFENDQHTKNSHPKNTIRLITNKNYYPRDCVTFKSPVKTGNNAIRRLIFLLNNSVVVTTFN